MKMWFQSRQRLAVAIGFFACLLPCLLPESRSATAPQEADDFDREVARFSKDLTDAIERAGATTVAVLDFTNLRGEKSELGRLLAEEVSSQLVVPGKSFKVLDRLNLKMLMQENNFDYNLSKEGMMPPEEVRRLGKIAGVQTFIVGTIAPFADFLRVNAKGIASDTAQVVAAAQGRFIRNSTLDELFGIPATKTHEGRMGGDAANTTSPAGSTSSAGPVRVIDLGDLTIAVQSARVIRSGLLTVVLSMKRSIEDGRHVFLNPALVTGSDDLGNEYALLRSPWGNHGDPMSGLHAPTGLPLQGGLPFVCQLEFQSGRIDRSIDYRAAVEPTSLRTLPRKFSFGGRFFISEGRGGRYITDDQPDFRPFSAPDLIVEWPAEDVQ